MVYQSIDVFFLRNVSFATLRQVNEIERKIEEAHKLREEARTLQNSTDKMVAEIMQITDEVGIDCFKVPSIILT